MSTGLVESLCFNNTFVCPAASRVWSLGPSLPFLQLFASLHVRLSQPRRQRHAHPTTTEDNSLVTPTPSERPRCSRSFVSKIEQNGGYPTSGKGCHFLQSYFCGAATPTNWRLEPTTASDKRTIQQWKRQDPFSELELAGSRLRPPLNCRKRESASD